MRFSLRILFPIATIFFLFITIILCPTNTHGEVYVNMLWDDHYQSYRVKVLSEDDGITFDRDYQNAYGAAHNLDPGPPFIVESSILSNGAITFESGSFDPTNPFLINVQIGENHEGLISGGGGVNFIGTPLDPIRIEGTYKIQCGVDYEYNSFQWINTEFRCTYSDIVRNSFPFTASGCSALIENCYFPDYSEPFSYLLNLLDFGNEKSCIVTIRNCRFERFDFPNQIYPIIVRDAAEFTLEDCHFEDISYWESDGSGLIDIRNCGIKSIKGNTAHNVDQSKLYMVGARVEDSTFIRCSESLPIISSTITVDPGAALAVGKGSLIKFLVTGGFDVGGRLYIDSTILTSAADDEYGGDTDTKPQPDPFVANWMTGGSGIMIDSNATAEIRRTLIRYPRSGIHSFGGLTLDGVTIENSWYSGVVLRGAGAHNYDISNTTIQHITRLDPFSAAIYFENRTAYHQTLKLNNVSLFDNVVDGVEVFYLEGAPTSIELNDCHISNNAGYGIVFPIDNDLVSIDIHRSVFVGNNYTAIRGIDAYGTGVPITIDNNVLIGNGLNQYGTYPYGIHLSGGEATIVGNTIIDNGNIGILVGGLDNIEQCVVANNLIVGQAEYGLYKSDDGAPIVVGNNFWNNGNETQELLYEGPDGRIYTVDDLQALGGDFVTNINVDPGLLPEIFGQIDTVIYDSRSGLSKLVDALGSFPSAETLVSHLICPDTSNPRWHPIWNVSGDTLIILGDIRDHADTGSTYRILDYHFSETSQLIDAGFTSQTQEMFDIDGEARILDGDENGSMLVDVGADEYNPSASSEGIRVHEPSSEKLLMSYTTFNIQWQAPDSVTLVDIAYNTSYDPAHPDDNWSTIAAGTDASSGYYSWEVPPYEYSMDCRIRVVATAHPGLVGMSAPFKIKHYGLSRVSDDSHLLSYAHPDDSWQFPNDSANMWPQEAWVDYMNVQDTITGFQYPLEFADLAATPSDFPSWPTFVEAFGFDACYFDYWLGPQYRPSAVLRWGAIKHAWNGSCFGLAITNLMAYQDSASFAARPEIGTFDLLHNLTMTTGRRSLINRYYTYQFGNVNIDHMNTARSRTPSETLNDLKGLFSVLSVSGGDRILTLCDTSEVNNQGCHSVTPYLLDRVSKEDNTWSLLVYDNNVPNDFPTVEIDAKNGSWTYAQLGWAGDKLFFVEDSLSHYSDPAHMTAAQRALPPVAASSSDYLEMYIAPSDSVRLELGTLAIGKYNDSLFCNVPGAMPIIPRADGPGEPIGYIVPAGNWSCRLAGSGEDYAHLTVFNDDVIMAYRRDSVGANDVEQVDIRGGDGMHLDNPDGAVRTCDLDFVVVQPDREQHLALGDLQIPAADSVALELTPTNGLRLANFGAASSYDLVIRDLGGPEMKEFIHFDIAVGANSEQHLVPNWNNVSEAQLMVIVDDGIDGVIDDTLYLSNGSPLDVEDDHGSLLPYRFELSQNYPNPFNPATTIEYSLPRRSSVRIDVFNLLGQKVRTLVDREESAGAYSITWDGTSSTGEAVSTGVYLYRFQADDHVETKKMLLLK